MADKAEHVAELEARVAVLEAELARYREAVEHIHQGLCVFDSEGRITLTNRAYAEILRLRPGSIRPGMTGADVVALGMAAGHYPADKSLEQITTDIRKQFERGAPAVATMVRDGHTYAVKHGQTAQGHVVTTCEEITPQVEAQNALRESEARLAAILDAMPDCVKIFDESGKLIHINPSGLELLQAPDLESLSRPGYVPVPLEYLDDCIDVHRRVIAGESVVWTYEVIGLHGRRRHVEAHAVPFRLPDGSRAHMCISRDVNERQEAHEALRRSEERLRLVQEATGLAEFESGEDGLIYCSDRFFDQLGLPNDGTNVVSKAWAEHIHPEDRERVERDIVASLERRDEMFNSEFRIVRADNGQVRWLSCHTRMEWDENGTLIRTIGSHLDITDRKSADDALRRSEKRLRLVQEATGLADFEADANGLAQFSPSLLKQMGLPADHATSMHFNDWLPLVHPEDRERLIRIEQALTDADAHQLEFRIRRADTGEVRWIAAYLLMERDEAGTIVRSIGAHLDITERRQAEEALRESEERFRLAAEAAGLGVWDYDMDADRREWSDRLRQILGVGPDDEPSLALAEECIHPADRERFQDTLREARNSDVARFEATFRIRRPVDRAERWITLNGWRTLRPESRQRRIIMTMRDVTEEKTAEERIRWSASHDALTRLANRTLFHEKLDAAFEKARESGRAVGVMLLDMDHFKQINDSLGHDAGDMLLKMFAKRLRGVVRHCDTVARFGGDEFAVVMPELEGEHSLLRVSRAIQQRLREPFVHGGRILDCRVSIGASLYPQHGGSPAELLKNADVALYAAKGAGRGIVTVFEPHMRDNVQRRNSMVHLARTAIEDDRIVPYYQPKLDLTTRSLVGFEALLRWRNPRGRIGQPAAIEAAFEDSDVAAQISDRMIERVIADMRGWLERGVDFKSVAVNASAAEFRRDNFAERVLEQLRRAEIPTRCFQLEITETVFLGRGAEYVHRALALLNLRGVKIALDDFGTGYASLRHLKQFPVDIIKIDQSFVRDMAIDPGDEAIVRAVINLGRSLGIRIVAEGIETPDQERRLIELECDMGQGYLYSRAVPASRVSSLVDLWPAPKSASSTRPPRDLRLVANRD